MQSRYSASLVVPYAQRSVSHLIPLPPPSLQAPITGCQDASFNADQRRACMRCLAQTDRLACLGQTVTLFGAGERCLASLPHALSGQRVPAPVRCKWLFSPCDPSNDALIPACRLADTVSCVWVGTPGTKEVHYRLGINYPYRVSTSLQGAFRLGAMTPPVCPRRKKLSLVGLLHPPGGSGPLAAVRRWRLRMRCARRRRADQPRPGCSLLLCKPARCLFDRLGCRRPARRRRQTERGAVAAWAHLKGCLACRG